MLATAAIRKYIGEHHGKALPANWEKTLSVQIKRLAAAGKLNKVITVPKPSLPAQLPCLGPSSCAIWVFLHGV